jgi:hypothetical protein
VANKIGSRTTENQTFIFTQTTASKFWHQTKHAHEMDPHISQEMKQRMIALPELLPLRWLLNIKSPSSSESYSSS